MSEMGRSGDSQHWQPDNPPSVSSQPSPVCGPLGLSVLRAEADVFKIPSSQSSVGPAPLPQSQFGTGQAALSQPQSSLTQSVVPQTDVSKAVPTQAQSNGISQALSVLDQPRLSQTKFSLDAQASGQSSGISQALSVLDQPRFSQTKYSLDPQASVGQSVFSQPRHIVDQGFSAHVQPGHKVFPTTSGLGSGNDKLGRSEADAASTTCFYQTRSSQSSANHLEQSQPKTDRTLSGAALSNSSEYRSVVNDQSSPYFQQLHHQPQSRALASQCHVQATMPGVAALDRPDSNLFPTRNSHSGLALQAQEPLPHSTNKVSVTISRGLSSLAACPILFLVALNECVPLRLS